MLSKWQLEKSPCKCASNAFPYALRQSLENLYELISSAAW